MADAVQLAFGQEVERTAHDLASMSGVDLARARPATMRIWEARSLALHHLAACDMAEALKVMDAALPTIRPSRIPPMNQPRTAAKET